MIYTLEKQIHSCCASIATGDVWLKYDINLPFNPYKGLLITSYKCDFEETIIKIYWDLDDKKWVLYVEPDKTFCIPNFKNFKDTLEFKDLIEKYKSKGWRE